MIDPVRPIALERYRSGARSGSRRRCCERRWSSSITATDAPDIYLKLENLQPTNAYKIRGAANAVAHLSDEERARGVWTISAGNAGQGVAYAARAFGVPCSVVAIETAPQTKLDRMRALGATIVPVSYETAWQAAESHSFEGMDATFIHPFDNHDFIAGHGTMGLEIVEDLPDVRTVIAAIGGGGLITGVGSAVKALQPDVTVIGAEPETAAPYAYSLAHGGPQRFPDWQASFVDGAGGKSVTDRMWERMQPVVDGIDRRHARRDPSGDAADRREGAGDCRGGGRAVAGGGAHRQGRATGRSSASFRAATSTSRNSASWSPDQRPVKFGGRFSRNAATPSR